jgi:hypothetical protein
MTDWINMAHWGWPQLLVIGLWATSFGAAVSKHGEVKDQQIWDAKISAMAICIVAFVLAAGGFFN